MEVKACRLLSELSARIPDVRDVVASLPGGQRRPSPLPIRSYSTRS